MQTILAPIADVGTAHSVLPSMPIVLSSVSICIAIAAFFVAFRNFRLSRFPNVRLIFNVHYLTSIENPKGAHYFTVEVES